MKTVLKRLLVIMLLLNAVAFAANVKSITIYFAKDKSFLTAGEAEKLKLLKNADLVNLQGHTDNDGSDKYNIGLSEKRVEAVRSAVSNITQGARIETGYFGETKPLNANLGEEEKALNRRVEISYICDPLLRTKVQSQLYEIDNSSTQILRCKEGTEIEIPQGAFGNKKVSLQVSEYYDPLAIFSANLSTTSNGRPIETAGMINISAKIDGKSVEPSKPLSYKFPRGNVAKDFKFFAGERNEKFEMNWITGNKQKTDSVKIYRVVQETDEIDSLMDFGGLVLTSAVSGGPLPELQACITKMAVGFSENDFVSVQDCIYKATVDISVNRDGRITGLTTSYTDKNTECDRPIQQFMRKYLPARFNKTTTDAKVHMAFSSKEGQLRIQALGLGNAPVVNKVGAWTSEVPDFGGNFTADYETDKIVLKSKSLGWINCDRFMSANKLVDYTVKTDTNANVRLVLKKYKAYFVNEFWGSYTQEDAIRAENAGRYIFNRVPDNLDAIVISTKKENGKLYLAMQDAKISSGKVLDGLNYKEVSALQLQEAIKNLKL
jgi:hypothetical protein